MECGLLGAVLAYHDGHVNPGRDTEIAHLDIYVVQYNNSVELSLRMLMLESYGHFVTPFNLFCPYNRRS
jgi:hypothetical protein